MFQQARLSGVVFSWIISMIWTCTTGPTLIAQDDAVRTPQAKSETAAGAPVQEEEEEPEYFDIGNVHFAVSTSSQRAQLWFDRGLAMCFAFNHEEAVRCFEKAIQADPSMPMAYWGMAYAWGPNINNMEIPESQIAQAVLAIRLGRLQAKRASDLELALLDALEKRYTLPMPEDRAPLNKAYSDAMRRVHAQFQDQPVVVSLFAESLMDLRPWQQWSADGKPAPETEEIVSVIEDGLRRWPDDPMLCHLYIHAMEASPNAGKALEAANRLSNAMPGSGHMVHMPSHIYVVLGDYAKVIEANRKAIEVDDKFAESRGKLNFYTIYRVHNHHFLVYGAMFDGQSQLAMDTARRLREQIPVEMLKAQVDYLDGFMPTLYHVQVRFGKWDDILQEPEPAEYLPMTRSIWRYARALAYASTGRLEEADKEAAAFQQARRAVPETNMLFHNSSQQLLKIADAMLRGEIAYRRGEYDAAFELLREAVCMDDALNYDEPWGWMQPARHALGALLLEQGHHDEAEKVFRVDLKKHPHNPWALHGLAEALEHQGETEQAAKIRMELALATQRADVPIDRSCYCRLSTE